MNPSMKQKQMKAETVAVSASNIKSIDPAIKKQLCPALGLPDESLKREEFNEELKPHLTEETYDRSKDKKKKKHRSRSRSRSRSPHYKKKKNRSRSRSTSRDRYKRRSRSRDRRDRRSDYERDERRGSRHTEHNDRKSFEASSSEPSVGNVS